MDFMVVVSCYLFTISQMKMFYTNEASRLWSFPLKLHEGRGLVKYCFYDGPTSFLYKPKQSLCSFIHFRFDRLKLSVRFQTDMCLVLYKFIQKSKESRPSLTLAINQA